MEISDFSKYKNQIPNILIIIVALIIGGSLYSNQVKKVGSLKVKEQEAIKVNQIISEIAASDKQISLYKQALGSGDMSVLINEVNDIAAQAQVKVLAIRPLNETALQAYAKQELEVSVSAPDSHRIGKFISGLENSEKVFIVGSFTEGISQSTADQYSRRQAAGAQEVSARIVLSAIFIRD